MSKLEHQYRRLLRLYPRPHRRVHEEEMLAVLLACAAPGQQRATRADRIDLVRGALRVRWRHLQSVFGPEWSDALAVVSLIAPLLMLACSPNPMVGVVVDGDFDPRGLDGVPFDPGEILVRLYVVGWTIVALAGLAGKRWTSAATAAVLAVMALYFRITDLMNGYWSDMVDPPLLLTGLICAIAFIASPGPRRGAQLIGVRGTLLAVAAAALIFALNRTLVPYVAPYLSLLPYLLLVPAVVGQSAIRLRVAALVVPHLAGIATYWGGAWAGLFTTETSYGVEALLYDQAYYSAYAVALLSLLFLWLRARAASDGTSRTALRASSESAANSRPRAGIQRRLDEPPPQLHRRVS
jgi:hypothetical protein